ncbi:hypothetical protein GCM10009415_19240 [Chitinophaga japonensis]
MKSILVLAVLIFPLALHAQTTLSGELADEFSTRVAERFQPGTDAATVFVADQLSRSGSGGLEIDKTMMELKKDPAALDAALKYLYQYSNCNRQELIGNLRTMGFSNNSVYALATYTVNKYKGEAKALQEEKAELERTGQIAKVRPPVRMATDATNAAPATGAAPAAAGNTGAAPAAGATAAAAATPAEDPFNWDVRNIFPLSKPEQLIAMYGKEHVAIRAMEDLEGNELGQGYYIFPDSPNEMEVFFAGDSGKIITFTQERSKWKSPFGIKVGDPLEKVVKVNGRDFRINGFEWVNSGAVDSWEGGALEGKGVSIIFKAINTGDPKLYNPVTGDKKIKTDMSVLKKLGVVVEKVSFNTMPQQ